MGTVKFLSIYKGIGLYMRCMGGVTGTYPPPLSIYNG